MIAMYFLEEDLTYVQCSVISLTHDYNVVAIENVERHAVLLNYADTPPPKQ